MKKLFLVDKIKNDKQLQSTLKKVGAVIAGLLLVLAGYGVNFLVRPDTEGETKIEVQTVTETVVNTIELAEEQIPATIETEEGIIEVKDYPTVEAVGGNQLTQECPEGEEECGLGAYVYAPTETFTAFRDYTIGKCWNVDGAYGSQCYDLAALFWMNYTEDGRSFSTCGTGAVKNAWDCRARNAGDDFELVYSAEDIKAGDWIIFTGGLYGHVGEAMGPYNNGYVSLLGTNQGSTPCDGGGSAANIINISTKNFVGAFRPKTYIPAPEPEPELPDTSH